jgi:5'-3' exonuclease
VEGPKWDTNAITPGTDFMRKLRLRLEAMIAKHGKKIWVLSSSDEPGEGEHKLMAEWRSGHYNGNYAVYGLDADLIVLSILNREVCGLNNSVFLFREEVNAGKIAYDTDGEEIFEWFSINALRDWLASPFSPEKQRDFILNYCFTMSVLGNDFLPSSLGLKIRDDGHSELLEIVQGLSSQNIQLIHPETLQISTANLQSFFHCLVKDEASHIVRYISKKRMMSRNLVGNSVLSIGDNNWPLCRIEEEVLLMNNKELGTGWKEEYIKFMKMDFTANNIRQICREYLYGIQWIWSYYTGKGEICYNWHYPHSLPPLWEWLHSHLTKYGLPEFPANIEVFGKDIRPVEQLALVLPLESWHLIPNCPERSLPKHAPQFYPNEFCFESIGKRYFWECECMIPLPSILQIKQIIKDFSAS